MKICKGIDSLIHKFPVMNTSLLQAVMDADSFEG